MSASFLAFIAAISLISFVTVSWSGMSRRIVIGIALFSITGLIAAMSIAVLGAARDTYARRD